MSTLHVDMLSQVNRLEKAGLPREQAVAVVQCQQEALENTMVHTLATKADVLAVRLDISAIQSDILKWVAGMLVAQAALVSAMVKLL